MDDPCIVLVTGGSGCLGQHIIGLLQSRAHHVTEIRVLDLVKYVNKLDHIERVPVESYVGGINDVHLLRKACRDVVSVIHLAAVADTSLIPDPERTHRINVEGTASLLKIAKETSTIRRFIFCSSTSISMSMRKCSFNMTEDMPLPERRIFDPYAISKYRAEQLVIEANGSKLRTVSLRPITLYGELDDMFVGQTVRAVAQMGGVLVPVKSGSTFALHQHAYVGNVAWGFVCAENKFHLQETLQTTSNLSQDGDEISTTSNETEFSNEETRPNNHDEDMSVRDSFTVISGKIYNIVDETEPESLFMFQKRFLEPCGYRVSSISCPAFVIYALVSILYYLLTFLALLGFKRNLSNGFQSVNYIVRSCTFNGDKAKRELGYRPLYSFQESIDRSVVYYKQHYGRNNS